MALINVLKYDGTPNILAWKHPNEELGIWTQLIVNESQEAVLYKGGQSLDLFAAGRHTLSAANIPLLRGLINLPFGGKSPFSAEVWYINKANSLDVKWGTTSPIQIQDPKHKVFVPVRAFGQFGIRISDSKVFLQKLVGTLPEFDTAGIQRYFRGLYITQAKDTISSYLIKKGVSVLEINAYLAEISDFLREKMIPTLNEYGIALVNFYLNDVSVPEDDSAVIQLKGALAKKAEMDIVGYSYGQERSFDVLGAAASNQGSMQSGLMGAGIGMGMGLGMGSSVGSQFAGLAGVINTAASLQPDQPKETIMCKKCGTANKNNTKFCAECGGQLIKICEKCGSAINGSPKFCPECGISIIKKCESCGAVIEGTPKFCSECGNKI